tara:strand:+ start:9685 stop:10797 length:1113 start_codon:yes stop_codon:yes gene_type:complete
MKVLLTGADGFIGKNVCLALSERPNVEVLRVTRNTDDRTIAGYLSLADAVVHLAGVNRPGDPSEFGTGNADFTARLVNGLRRVGRSVPIAFSSSIQAERDNPYGISKAAAERALESYSADMGAAVAAYRLPNVFGKWARPDYNSVVATFCHNIARGLPIEVHDPSSPLRLVYIDDVVAEFLRFLDSPVEGFARPTIAPEYSTTVGWLAEKIYAFGEVRSSLVSERVGEGLVRALYSTYVSYLPTSAFSYTVPAHGDQRGIFVEMLKTKDSGQVSFFTAHPGVTRGGHYHHTKTEKFLVIRGRALFRFRHMATNERFELETSGDESVIVETIPGWSHDITNVGADEMVVILWANEIFDRNRPDTIASKVDQ